MYRRHLRMVLVRDVESNNIENSEFLQRITSIPVVYLAWNIAAETYRSVKFSNRLIKASLTTTERVAGLISKPVIKKFKKQLKFADHLASKGLETLQGIVPTIYHQQERIYRHTKDIYDETVESGLKKYELVKLLGRSKVQDLVEFSSQKIAEFLASPYGENYELALGSAFDLGERYVDYYLPPLGDERPEKFFGDRENQPAYKRAEVLSNRFKERFYKHSLLKIQTFRLRSKYFIAKIYRFNMSQYILEVFTMTPTMVYTIAVQIFSNVEGMSRYLMTLIVSNRTSRHSIV